MAQLERTGRSMAIKGIGYARRGVIQTVPDDLVEELLATGEWALPGEATGASEPQEHPVPVDAPDSPETEDDADSEDEDESEEEDSEDDEEGTEDESEEGESEEEPDRVTEPAPAKPARRSRRKGK